ncbi:MAG: FtsX-like permease family protein [Pyrinomonadaceae bacterium]
MLFELNFIRRFRRSRRRGLVRFTSLVAVIGIAAGVASLIFALAVARGFRTEIREKILANTAHITILPKNVRRIERWRELSTEIERNPKVRSVFAEDFEVVLLITDASTEYAVLKARQSSREHVVATSNRERPSVSVGAELAATSGLAAGSEAQMLVRTADETPRATTVRIEKTTKTGIYEYDSTWITIAPADLAHIRGLHEFVPTALSININDIDSAVSVAGELRTTVGDEYRVIDWQEANQPLFTALSLERKAVAAILVLVVLIAAINITTTLALLVNERRLDIAVLRTCGAKSRRLIGIFVLEGLILGGIGIACGIFAGLIACVTANRFKLFHLPPDVYLVSHIQLEPSFVDIYLIVAATTAICLLATFYPALKASRIKPLENLRSQ